MAFPSAPVLDNFNRANEGPPPSASWTNGVINFGGAGVLVSANQAGASAAPAESYWNVSDFGPNTEVYAEVPTLPAVGQNLSLFFRLKEIAAGTTDGYALEYGNDVTDGHYLQFVRYDNAVQTYLGTASLWTPTAGDAVGAEAIGSTLNLYKRVSGVWSLAQTLTEATYGAAGKIGLGFNNTAPRVDNFGGGAWTGSTATVAWITA